jgi:hypothetical protein
MVADGLMLMRSSPEMGVGCVLVLQAATACCMARSVCIPCFCQHLLMAMA